MSLTPIFALPATQKIRQIRWVAAAAVGLVAVGFLVRYSAGAMSPGLTATLLLGFFNSTVVFFLPHLRYSAHFFVVGTVLCLSLGGFFSGGVGAPIMATAPLAPLFAGIVLGARAALWALAGMLLAMLAMLALQLSSAPVPTLELSPDKIVLMRTVVLSLTCVCLAVVTWIYSREYQILTLSLLTQAMSDSLTKIPNRRFFDEKLEREWLRAQREKYLMALVVVDIDRFKHFNDTNGHAAGDDCLVSIAGCCNQSLRREPDVFARIGGEEFAALLPHADADGAMATAEKLRQAVMDLNISYGDGSNNIVTISLGVAVVDPTAPESLPSLLMHYADEALYQSKNSGRNKVTLSSISSASKVLESE